MISCQYLIDRRVVSHFFLVKAIPIKGFVSHRPPSREGGSVGRAKKKRMNTCRVLSAREGRAAKYESLLSTKACFI